jgi:hypothetical protein
VKVLTILNRHKDNREREDGNPHLYADHNHNDGNLYGYRNRHRNDIASSARSRVSWAGSGIGQTRLNDGGNVRDKMSHDNHDAQHQRN